MWDQSLLANKRKYVLIIVGIVSAIVLICTHSNDEFSRELLHRLNIVHSSSPSIPHVSSSLFRIAVIGSSGYIGASLMDYLRRGENWTVVGYDRIFPGQASYEISRRELQRFQVVIYLGGLTGRVMCRDRPTEVDRENIDDIHNLAKRMLRYQLLIFASTSAIVEGSGSVPADENFPAQPNLLDTYANSLLRREEKLRRLSLASSAVPQMIGLRFGTVIGLSPSQRIDLAPMALVCQAFLTGRLRISHPESNRAFLSMEDLMRAVASTMKLRTQSKRFDIFHLQSFQGSISNMANAIASLTGAHVDASDHLVDQDSPGFSLNNTKFRTTFDFVFKDELNQVILRLISDVPRMCLGRQSRLDNGSVPCVVCGSRVMHTVLNLHNQPLANDFQTNKENSIKSKRFPLRLVRCPVCHHTQLSYIVDREYLFSHYLYQSGTSNSLKSYFAWLATKTINESGIINGTVLEIACNDGSQLNEFRKRGWKTVGVDPAKNLADIAKAKGHVIFTGFWGTSEFPSLSSLGSIDVIIAQNVLAHVATPLQFLRACVAIMSTETRLYIQTSQCEMYETGQFDTVYHEHVSFFTAHSFKKLADIVGLTIMHFEITPIHGRSCLVMFQRSKSSNIPLLTSSITMAASLSQALEKERKLGMSTPWFYVKYQAQAESMRQWIAQQLQSLQAQHHTIIAYGAAAKGTVLLHFLLEILDRSWNISFVVDDAPLKQNTFCPGTSIPVRPTTELSKCNPANPLTIIVFAWNFWEEILKKIRSETIQKGFESVFIVLPFPQQQLMKIDHNRTIILAQNPSKPLSWLLPSNSTRKPVLLITHFYNEEFLLPYWIRHHSSMFDMAILIDYNSTDQSREIIRREAPKTWQVVPSRNKQFEAQLVDDEVVAYEKMYPDAWKIALNIPEFLVHHNLREMLAESERSDKTMAFCFRSIIMSGNDSTPLTRFTSLLKQRSQYTYDTNNSDEKLGITDFSRFIHSYPFGKYTIGRHTLTEAVWKWATVGFIAKYQYAPWPEIINRKLQIRSRIPHLDFALLRGGQHNVNREQLEKVKENVQQMPQHDLRVFTAPSEELAMVHRLWKEITNQ